MNTTKKMSAQEFIKKYNALTSEKIKEDLLKTIVKDIYVPYENKITICEKIVAASYYIKTKDNNGIETKKMHINSPANYMFYCLNLINTYTSIEIDFNNALDEFNLLNANGCMDLIFDCISAREIQEFRMILDMVENDTIQNEYELHAFISNQVERFGSLTGYVLAPLLDKLMQSIDNIDEKTVDKLIKGINKNTKFNSEK